MGNKIAAVYMVVSMLTLTWLSGWVCAQPGVSMKIAGFAIGLATLFFVKGSLDRVG